MHPLQGNIQLNCMSTGERGTSMVMAATGGGRRLPRSLMPTNVPRADHKRVVATPFVVDAALIAVDPQGIPLRTRSAPSGGGSDFAPVNAGSRRLDALSSTSSRALVVVNTGECDRYRRTGVGRSD